MGREIQFDHFDFRKILLDHGDRESAQAFDDFDDAEALLGNGFEAVLELSIGQCLVFGYFHFQKLGGAEYMGEGIVDFMVQSHGDLGNGDPTLGLNEVALLGLELREGGVNGFHFGGKGFVGGFSLVIFEEERLELPFFLEGFRNQEQQLQFCVDV